MCEPRVLTGIWAPQFKRNILFFHSNSFFKQYIHEFPTVLTLIWTSKENENWFDKSVKVAKIEGGTESHHYKWSCLIRTKNALDNNIIALLHVNACSIVIRKQNVHVTVNWKI